jgi:ABC-type dipeptide/oligopeptide/nickel transport system permease component
VLVLLARRLIVVVPLLLAVSFIVFAIVDAFPGDACLLKHEKHASPELMAGCRKEYNLEGPFLERYGRFLAGANQLDFGK